MSNSGGGGVAVDEGLEELHSYEDNVCNQHDMCGVNVCKSMSAFNHRVAGVSGCEVWAIRVGGAWQLMRDLKSCILCECTSCN